MDDVVAVEVRTSDGSRSYFITWGRIQDRLDPGPLERLMLGVADHFALPAAVTSTRVCESLSEARDAPYFYEALLEYAKSQIPFGDGYEIWRAERDQRMRDGQDIFFAGVMPAGD
jgi:hypothetical protein